MSSAKAIFRTALLFIIIVGLSSCSLLNKERPLFTPPSPTWNTLSEADSIQYLSSLRKAVKNRVGVRIHSDITIENKLASERFEQVLVAKFPGSLRLEVFAPAVRTLQLLVGVSENQVVLLDAIRKVAYVEGSQEEVFEKLFFDSLSVSELVNQMSGAFSIEASSIKQIFGWKLAKNIELDVVTNDKTYRLYLKVPERGVPQLQAIDSFRSGERTQSISYFYTPDGTLRGLEAKLFENGALIKISHKSMESLFNLDEISERLFYVSVPRSYSLGSITDLKLH